MLMQKIIGVVMILFGILVASTTSCGTPALLLVLTGVALVKAKEVYVEFLRR